jgi:nucleoside phosphorylase
MKVIVSAIFIEAKVFIEKYNLKIIKDRFFKIYQNEDYLVIISGVGKIKMAMATSYILYKINPSIIINFGISASLSHNIGDVFLINKIIDFASNRSYYPDILRKHNLKECDIITYDTPQSDDTNILNKNHLIDMEASGFFQSAFHFTALHKIMIIKVISDNANKGTLIKSMVQEICFNAFDKIDYFLQNYIVVENELFSKQDIEKINIVFEKNYLSATNKEIYKKKYLYEKFKNKEEKK